MKDQRAEIIQKHYDIFFDHKKYKVIACRIDETNHTLSIKTKVHGQPFPMTGRFTFAVPSEQITEEICISFQSMCNNSSIEHWQYTIIQDR